MKVTCAHCKKIIDLSDAIRIPIERYCPETKTYLLGYSTLVTPARVEKTYDYFCSEECHNHATEHESLIISEKEAEHDIKEARSAAGAVWGIVVGIFFVVLILLLSSLY